MVFSFLTEIEGDEPLCLRFVDTVGNRLGSSPDDYWKAPSDVARWFAARGLLGSEVLLTEADRERAIGLRDAIFDLLTAHPPGESQLDRFNGELTEAFGKLELSPQGEFELVEPRPFERALMLVALSAANLATGELAERVRRCADPECGWLFLDRSKNRSRRWCDMADCGNRAKARRFQERRRENRG